MGKTFLFITMVIVLSVSRSFATNLPDKPLPDFPPINAKDIMVTIGDAGNAISLLDLAFIGVRDFEKLANKKLNIWERIGFKISQKKLRNKLNEDGTIKTDIARKLITSMADAETGFHGGGFLLGLFLSWIGVVAAYLIEDDKRRNRVKWAWIGAGVNLLFFLFVLTQVFKTFR